MVALEINDLIEKKSQTRHSPSPILIKEAYRVTLGEVRGISMIRDLRKERAAVYITSLSFSSINS